MPIAPVARPAARPVLLLLTALVAGHAAAVEPICEPPRTSSADTGGQCCWEGQAWNGVHCVGLPLACPAGWHADTMTGECVTGGCTGGTVATGGPYCCWPGQAWDRDAERCVGEPVCSAGLVSHGEIGCAPPGALLGALSPSGAVARRGIFEPALRGKCAEGEHQALDGEHCCPPGWAWSTPRGRCVGAAPLAGLSLELFGRVDGITEGEGSPPGARGPAPASPRGPIVLGALTHEQVDAGLAKRARQVDACRAAALAERPGGAGAATVKLVVDEQGRVASATASPSSPADAAFGACLEAALAPARFAKPEVGSVLIRYRVAYGGG